ncbi:MAG TPA: LysR family transcriptional regulator [Candidatus Binatia bacterium]|nr:LysR family transcriptional regulator [Candidatus Binatia bacterium]
MTCWPALFHDGGEPSWNMNIHHLELFYYVARHGGITEAVRNIPYGIQQPAVSGQVAQLEEYLGVILFQRRPFALTPAGEKLYQFIVPFFSNLETVAGELQGGRERQIRVGASTIVLRDHLPEFLRNVRKKYPNLKISLREGYQAELEILLEKEELDLAVTVIEKKSAPGIHSVALLELPLVLLVEKGSSLTAAEQLWKRDRIQEPLICLREAEAISKHFRQGLSRLGVDWFPSIEVSSIDLIETYVASGFGIGVSVQVPKAAIPPNTRVVPLPARDFAPVIMGALWRGRTSVLLQAFLDECQLRAKRLAGG